MVTTTIAMGLGFDALSKNCHKNTCYYAKFTEKRLTKNLQFANRAS